MGIGDAFSSFFGGNNSYKNVNSPMLGRPQRPGESRADYQNSLYKDHQNQMSGFQKQSDAAGRAGLPQNVLNMGQANTTAAQQSQLANALQGRAGQNIDFGSANATLGQNQALIDRLMAQGMGEGPNPALNQLRMATDSNIRNQAAMAASQRGINPAMAARLSANAGASANQNAAGQGALMSAQQQLGAQQAAGGLLGQQAGLQSQMAGMNAQQQQNYMNMLGQALQAQRGQDISQASAQGQAGLGLMGQRLGGQQLASAERQNYQQNLQNAYNAMNNINAGVAAQNAGTSAQYGMGALSGLSSMLSAGAKFGAMYEGGEVPNTFVDAIKKKGRGYANGGVIDNSDAFLQNQFARAMSNTEAAGAKLSQDMSKNFGMGTIPFLGGGQAPIGGTPGLGGVQGGDNFSFMGQTPTGGGIMSGSGALGGVGSLSGYAMSEGGKVDGRAKTPGDSPKNDTVPAMLSPGEIVIPRTATESPEDAHEFLDAIMKKKKVSYGDVLQAQRTLAMWHGGRC